MASDKPEELIDPLADVLGYQLRRASLATMTVLNERFEEIGLRPTEAIILRFVSANPGCNQSAIGRALGVKRTNMVPIVAGLEARGLLNRTPADGRSNALTLTEAGWELFAKVRAAADEVEAQFYGWVPDDLRDTVLGLCREVRRRADEA